MAEAEREPRDLLLEGDHGHVADRRARGASAPADELLVGGCRRVTGVRDQGEREGQERKDPSRVGHVWSSEGRMPPEGGRWYRQGVPEDGTIRVAQFGWRDSRAAVEAAMRPSRGAALRVDSTPCSGASLAMIAAQPHTRTRIVRGRRVLPLASIASQAAVRNDLAANLQIAAPIEIIRSSSFGAVTTCPAGTLRVRKTPPAMTLPRPMTVSPPRIVAPA